MDRTVIVKEELVMNPNGARHQDRLTNRQSQCDVESDFASEALFDDWLNSYFCPAVESYWKQNMNKM